MLLEMLLLIANTPEEKLLPLWTVYSPLKDKEELCMDSEDEIFN